MYLTIFSAVRQQSHASTGPVITFHRVQKRSHQEATSFLNPTIVCAQKYLLNSSLKLVGTQAPPPPRRTYSQLELQGCSRANKVREAKPCSLLQGPTSRLYVVTTLDSDRNDQPYDLIAGFDIIVVAISKRQSTSHLNPSFSQILGFELPIQDSKY